MKTTAAISNYNQDRQHMVGFTVGRLAVLAALLVMAVSPLANAFTVAQNNRRATTSVFAIVMDVPVVMHQAPQQTPSFDASASSSSSWMSQPTLRLKEQAPSTLLAIQEYKTPTKEELAQKKRNFNLIFWGGGFVAPFLATIFYFGFRFWEK